MTTLAKELEELEASRRAGTLSEEDVADAKKALLQRHSGAPQSAAGGLQSPPARREPRTLMGIVLAGVFSNLLMSVVIFAFLAGMVYMLVPLTLAVPIMICMVLALPFMWLWEKICDIFS